MSTYVEFGDAAFPQGLDGTSFPGVGGYYGGPYATNVWTPAEWAGFPGYRLPIFVAAGNATMPPGDGPEDGAKAVALLRKLGVPKGCRTVVDMEGHTNARYVSNFGTMLQGAGYLVEVYGSASSVFSLPPLNGYWVADFTPDMTAIRQLLTHPHVRAVQFEDTGPYDVSLRKPWTEGEMWHG